MNIMRDTLLIEKREDLLEKLDLYDTRVIGQYISMGVPFPEETKELLMMELNEKLCLEINVVSERHPEILQRGYELVDALSTSEKIFNGDLVEALITTLKRMVEEGDIEAANCMNKCFTYYTSFFLDDSEDEDDDATNEEPVVELNEDTTHVKLVEDREKEELAIELNEDKEKEEPVEELNVMHKE